MTELGADVSCANDGYLVAIVLEQTPEAEVETSDKGRHELPLSNAFSCCKRELESPRGSVVESKLLEFNYRDNERERVLNLLRDLDNGTFDNSSGALVAISTMRKRMRARRFPSSANDKGAHSKS